jgi:hypothetical protein
MASNTGSPRGSPREQHAKAGSQSHKKSPGSSSASKGSSSMRGGASEQHSKAGSQSHKNSNS